MKKLLLVLILGVSGVHAEEVIEHGGEGHEDPTSGHGHRSGTKGGHDYAAESDPYADTQKNTRESEYKKEVTAFDAIRNSYQSLLVEKVDTRGLLAKLFDIILDFIQYDVLRIDRNSMAYHGVDHEVIKTKLQNLFDNLNKVYSNFTPSEQAETKDMLEKIRDNLVSQYTNDAQAQEVAKIIQDGINNLPKEASEPTDGNGDGGDKGGDHTTTAGAGHGAHSTVQSLPDKFQQIPQTSSDALNMLKEFITYSKLQTQLNKVLSVIEQYQTASKMDVDTLWGLQGALTDSYSALKNAYNGKPEQVAVDTLIQNVKTVMDTYISTETQKLIDDEDVFNQADMPKSTVVEESILTSLPDNTKARLTPVLSPPAADEITEMVGKKTVVSGKKSLDLFKRLVSKADITVTGVDLASLELQNLKQSDVKKIYNKLSAFFHPDKVLQVMKGTSLSEEQQLDILQNATEWFKLIGNAKDKLMALTK